MDRQSQEQLTRHGKALFQHFYAKLVDILPMDDADFTAELFRIGLLPGNRKDMISAQGTRKNKSVYFLDNVIKPGVTCDVGTGFHDLLTVMEHSEYKDLKSLAEQIKNWMKEEIVNVDLDDG